MFGGFFNRMYYGDPRKPDLKKEDLKGNRFKLFTTVLCKILRTDSIKPAEFILIRQFFCCMLRLLCLFRDTGGFGCI